MPRVRVHRRAATRVVTATGLLIAVGAPAAPVDDADDGDEPAFCKDVTAGEAIRFGTRPLIETPDIGAPGGRRALLEHGAEVEGLEFCASPANGDCRVALLPILDEYARRPRVTRT
jgi:hypothetical protein